MRKEIFIVILVGVLIGAVITFGIYRAQIALNQEEIQDNTVQAPTPSPSQQTSAHALTILSPANESVVDQDSVSITGKTSPDSVLAVIAPESEYLLTADSEGDFTVEVGLVGGANEINISSFDDQGNKAEQVLTVVYSTAEL